MTTLLSRAARFTALATLTLGLAACDSVSPDLADDLAGAPLADASASAAPAGARLATCTGTLGAITVEDIVVPDGATCVLDGTTVQANISVGTHSRLTARRVTAGGNVQAQAARSVRLVGSVIGGNVQLEQGAGGLVRTTRIGGDLQVDQNAALYTLDRNRIDGNLQAFGNTGGLAITSNRVRENLQCGENQPAPTGFGNTAASLEGQCASLGATSDM